MNLDHLETFLSIYRHKNLSRAAEELHLSQPAVTNHLKALETHLGRPLFLRQTRGVTPTPLADSLANNITTPLQTLTATVSALASGANELDKTIYIGGPSDALATRVVPALFPLISSGLRVHAATGTTSGLLDRLSLGELDLVIATTPSRRRGITMIPLFTETLALVAGTAWAERLVNPSIEDLNNAPMIAYAENLQLIRRYCRDVFSSAPPKQPQLVLNDLRGIIAAAVSNAGWTVVPTYLATSEVASGALKLLHHPRTPPSNTLQIATLSGREDPTVTAVTRVLLGEASRW